MYTDEFVFLNRISEDSILYCLTLNSWDHRTVVNQTINESVFFFLHNGINNYVHRNMLCDISEHCNGNGVFLQPSMLWFLLVDEPDLNPQGSFGPGLVL